MGNWSIKQLDVGDRIYKLHDSGFVVEYRVLSRAVEDWRFAILNEACQRIDFLDGGDLSSPVWFDNKADAEYVAKEMRSSRE